MKLVLIMFIIIFLVSCSKPEHDKVQSDIVKSMFLQYDDQLFVKIRTMYGELDSSARLVLIVKESENINITKSNMNNYLSSIHNRIGSFDGAIKEKYLGDYYRLYRAVEKNIWQIMQKKKDGDIWHGSCLKYTSGYVGCTYQSVVDNKHLEFSFPEEYVFYKEEIIEILKNN